jgi:putative heme-binding domain-containing protein
MKRIVPWIVPGLLLGVLASAPVVAQNEAKVPDPDPELERKSFEVADGFEVNLFAADPLLAKPIQMNFDARGRLWVACSESYPQIKPGAQQNDKIIILEDTQGEGKVDKTTVFADGLLIPTGLEPGDGGVYVADSTDLLHLSTSPGKEKADKRKVVLSGFGTEDTHHMLHTLRWGPDGMLYMNQSIYIHSHIETPHGPRELNAGGVWQFRPETLELGVFARGWVNPWGHAFDRWGQSFVTDGAGGEGINYVLPGGYYTTAANATRVIQGLNPGSPKYCGLEIVSGRHFPDDWQGNLITNDFRGHRVCRFVLKEDGAAYAALEKSELIKTRHEAFRPVDVKMGPDGALYIADWYNPIIQHGEVDFRDPRRDISHGRIWRVTAKGRALVKRPKLVDAPTAALLDELKAPEQWTRHFAKRVLKERGAAKVEPGLAKWVAKLDRDDKDYEHHLLEALWTYQSLDVVEPKLLTTLARAKDHHARAAAMRVISAWHKMLDNPLELLAAGVADDHPQVRLEAVRSLAMIRQPRAVELAMDALDRPVDKYVDYALWLTARELETVWMPELEKGNLNYGGKVGHMLFALQAVGTKSVVKPLVDLIQSGKVPPDREDAILATIAGVGGPQELDLLLNLALSKETVPPSRQATLLTALEQAERQRNVKPTGDLTRIAPLLKSDDEAVRAAGARLAGLWQVQKLRAHLLDLAKGATTGNAVRRGAMEGLVSLGGKESKDALLEMCATEQIQQLRLQTVVALAQLDPEAAAPRAVDVLAGNPTADVSDVFAAFVQRKNGPDLLAKALADKKLPADVARTGIRAARASGRDHAALIAALTKAGGLTNINHTLTADQMDQMVADVRKQGDPAKGEAIYRRMELSCLKCHAIAGSGGQVGPDLASIGASAPIDYIIDSILLPNKAIKENYHSLAVTTKGGKVYTGIKVRETNTELVLRDADDKEITIPIKSIDERNNGGSLMPEGLADGLTRAELIDLVRFMSELGKTGPYAVSKARQVRTWRVLEPTPEGRTLLVRTSIASATGNDPALVWAPAYTTVGGTLPLDVIPKIDAVSTPTKGIGTMGFVRCQIEATTAGKVKLLLNSPKDVRLWLGNEPIEPKDEFVLNLKTGMHTLTFALDLTQRKDGLSLELDDVAGSPARARVVNGK